MNTDLITFIQTWTGGVDVSDAERQRLLRRLETDADFRAECAEEIRLLGMIKAVQTPPPRWLGIADALGLNAETMADSGTSDLATQVMERMRQREPNLQFSRSRWLSWRPLAAAAAGIVFGIICTSVVFAYVAPSLGKVLTLLDDGFESGPAPLVTGVPVEPGRWSGDYSEVVGEQQGVKPESGKKMLRLLRGDYEGKANAKGSHVADIYRLIDVRPYRQEFADGSAVVQLSAGFNAFEFPQGETYTSKMTIHAFDAETATNGSLRAVSAWDESCLATAGTGPMKLDRNPATWQQMTTDLRLPANTDFVMIHLMIPAAPRTHTQEGFGGHYIDDVRLTLRHSPPR